MKFKFRFRMLSLLMVMIFGISSIVNAAPSALMMESSPTRDMSPEPFVKVFNGVKKIIDSSVNKGSLTNEAFAMFDNSKGDSLRLLNLKNIGADSSLIEDSRNFEVYVDNNGELAYRYASVRTDDERLFLGTREMESLKHSLPQRYEHVLESVRFCTAMSSVSDKDEFVDLVLDAFSDEYRDITDNEVFQVEILFDRYSRIPDGNKKLLRYALLLLDLSYLGDNGASSEKGLEYTKTVLSELSDRLSLNQTEKEVLIALVYLHDLYGLFSTGEAAPSLVLDYFKDNRFSDEQINMYFSLAPFLHLADTAGNNNLQPAIINNIVYLNNINSIVELADNWGDKRWNIIKSSDFYDLTQQFDRNIFSANNFSSRLRQVLEKVSFNGGAVFILRALPETVRAQFLSDLSNFIPGTVQKVNFNDMSKGDVDQICERLIAHYRNPSLQPRPFNVVLNNDWTADLVVNNSTYECVVSYESEVRDREIELDDDRVSEVLSLLNKESLIAGGDSNKYGLNESIGSFFEETKTGEQKVLFLLSDFGLSYDDLVGFRMSPDEKTVLLFTENEELFVVDLASGRLFSRIDDVRAETLMYKEDKNKSDRFVPEIMVGGADSEALETRRVFLQEKPLVAEEKSSSLSPLETVKEIYITVKGIVTDNYDAYDQRSAVVYEDYAHQVEAALSELSSMSSSNYIAIADVLKRVNLILDEMEDLLYSELDLSGVFDDERNLLDDVLAEIDKQVVSVPGKNTSILVRSLGIFLAIPFINLLFPVFGNTADLGSDNLSQGSSLMELVVNFWPVGAYFLSIVVLVGIVAYVFTRGFSKNDEMSHEGEWGRRYVKLVNAMNEKDYEYVASELTCPDLNIARQAARFLTEADVFERDAKNKYYSRLLEADAYELRIEAIEYFASNRIDLLLKHLDKNEFNVVKSVILEKAGFREVVGADTSICNKLLVTGSYDFRQKVMDQAVLKDIGYLMQVIKNEDGLFSKEIVEQAAGTVVDYDGVTPYFLREIAREGVLIDDAVSTLAAYDAKKQLLDLLSDERAGKAAAKALLDIYPDEMDVLKEIWGKSFYVKETFEYLFDMGSASVDLFMVGLDSIDKTQRDLSARGLAQLASDRPEVLKKLFSKGYYLKPIFDSLLQSDNLRMAAHSLLSVASDRSAAYHARQLSFLGLCYLNEKNELGLTKLNQLGFELLNFRVVVPYNRTPHPGISFSLFFNEDVKKMDFLGYDFFLFMTVLCGGRNTGFMKLLPGIEKVDKFFPVNTAQKAVMAALNINLSRVLEQRPEVGQLYESRVVIAKKILERALSTRNLQTNGLKLPGLAEPEQEAEVEIGKMARLVAFFKSTVGYKTRVIIASLLLFVLALRGDALASDGSMTKLNYGLVTSAVILTGVFMFAIYKFRSKRKPLNVEATLLRGVDGANPEQLIMFLSSEFSSVRDSAKKRIIASQGTMTHRNIMMYRIACIRYAKDSGAVKEHLNVLRNAIVSDELRKDTLRHLSVLISRFNDEDIKECFLMAKEWGYYPYEILKAADSLDEKLKGEVESIVEKMPIKGLLVYVNKSRKYKQSTEFDDLAFRHLWKRIDALNDSQRFAILKNIYKNGDSGDRVQAISRLLYFKESAFDFLVKLYDEKPSLRKTIPDVLKAFDVPVNKLVAFNIAKGLDSAKHLRDLFTLKDEKIKVKVMTSVLIYYDESSTKSTEEYQMAMLAACYLIDKLQAPRDKRKVVLWLMDNLIVDTGANRSVAYKQMMKYGNNLFKAYDFGTLRASTVLNLLHILSSDGKMVRKIWSDLGLHHRDRSVLANAESVAKKDAEKTFEEYLEPLSQGDACLMDAFISTFEGWEKMIFDGTEELKIKEHKKKIIDLRSRMHWEASARYSSLRGNEEYEVSFSESSVKSFKDAADEYVSEISELVNSDAVNQKIKVVSLKDNAYAYAKVVDGVLNMSDMTLLSGVLFNAERIHEIAHEIVDENVLGGEAGAEFVCNLVEMRSLLVLSDFYDKRRGQASGTEFKRVMSILMSERALMPEHREILIHLINAFAEDGGFSLGNQIKAIRDVMLALRGDIDLPADESVIRELKRVETRVFKQKSLSLILKDIAASRQRELEDMISVKAVENEMPRAVIVDGALDMGADELKYLLEDYDRFVYTYRDGQLMSVSILENDVIAEVPVSECEDINSAVNCINSLNSTYSISVISAENDRLLSIERKDVLLLSMEEIKSNVKTSSVSFMPLMLSVAFALNEEDIEKNQGIGMLLKRNVIEQNGNLVRINAEALSLLGNSLADTLSQLAGNIAKRIKQQVLERGLRTSA